MFHNYCQFQTYWLDLPECNQLDLGESPSSFSTGCLISGGKGDGANPAGVVRLSGHKTAVHLKHMATFPPELQEDTNG